MLYDVAFCRQLGCKGVVLGLLQKDSTVDIKRTSQLVEAAGEMEVTFHRAFDRTTDPVRALEDIVEVGCKRLLTSGQKQTAIEGATLIQQLVQQAATRIIVMPGSGVRCHNIAQVVTETAAVEYHSSAKLQVASKMEFFNSSFLEDALNVMVNIEEVQAMKDSILGKQNVML